MIIIKKIQTKGELKRFIDLPHLLYAEDPNYVPELYISQYDMFDNRKHPFHKHSKVDLYLAFNNDDCVGRIAAIKNNNHNTFNNCNDAFFGFFDTINDTDVAGALFQTVIQWAKKEGCDRLVGPTNFSTNESCGMLYEGFNSPPVVMMPYNKEYYNQLMSRCGFQKKMDLLAYHIDSNSLSEKAIVLREKIEERLKLKGIIIREIDHKNFTRDVSKIKAVYNSAWDQNSEFVPMTDEEFKHLANDLKMVYDPQLCFVAEHNGEVIGFALALPDINQALRKIKKGRLLPFGILKFLYYSRKIDTIRVLTLGVIGGYRKMGIESCIYARIIEAGRKKGIVRAEASWILENNVLMNQALLNLNSIPYKKYRLYQQSI